MFEPNDLLLVISFSIAISKEMMPTYLTFYTSSNRYFYMYDLVAISEYVDYMVYRPEFWDENDRFEQYDTLIQMGVPSQKIIMKLGQLRVAQWLDANALRFGVKRNLGGAAFTVMKASAKKEIKTRTRTQAVQRVGKNATVELIKNILSAIIVIIDIVLELIERFYPDFRK